MKEKNGNNTNCGKLLPLVEEFHTIQGEGYHSGEAAWFIRLGGCDVGCNWCDSRFSWGSSLFSASGKLIRLWGKLSVPAQNL